MTAEGDRYDRIGVGYTQTRRPDARIAAQITAALGDARSVCNVGAGAGAYEPPDCEVVAVEPSREMLRQRRDGRAVRAVAGALPFADGRFDAAMASLTIHHWPDPIAGLREMARVAPRRVVFTFEVTHSSSYWLVRDYVPEVAELDSAEAPALEATLEALGGGRVEPVPVPWDCSDGFLAAYWRRPERYLDPVVRAGISGLARLPAEVVERGMRRLEADLASGAWQRRHADLLARDEMDFGYRLVIADAAS